MSERIDEALGMLRGRGCSMIESMRILMLLMEISITDAKRIVHFSRTWSDLRESNEELHCTSEAVARIVAERGFPAAPGDRSDSDFER